MKAIVQTDYGLPKDVLRLQEIDIPAIGSDETLVRVHAASVHPDVWHVVRGLPYVLRVIGAGLLRLKNPVPGIDMAGVVESVGSNVVGFQPGDEVFGPTIRGSQWKNGGAYAEYVTVEATNLAHKPKNVTFEQAAAVTTSGMIALANVGDSISAGQTVLVNGAAGGVGAFVVQLAKSLGAEVTGVDALQKLDLLRSIGADHVVDYTQTDFVTAGQRYDVMIDVIGNRSWQDCKQVLTANGRYVLIGHEEFGGTRGRLVGRTMPRFVRLLTAAPFATQKIGAYRVEKDPNPVATLQHLVESGVVTPTIGRTFALEDVTDALHHLETGQTEGRIVITM